MHRSGSGSAEQEHSTQDTVHVMPAGDQLDRNLRRNDGSGYVQRAST